MLLMAILMGFIANATNCKIRKLLALGILTLSFHPCVVFGTQSLSRFDKAATISAVHQILHQAVKEAMKIDDPARRAQVLADITKEQAFSGDASGALRTMTTIEEHYWKEAPQQKSTIFHHIALAQAKGGDFKAALRTAEAMPESVIHSKDSTNTEIAKAQAAAGDVPGAMQIVAPIQKKNPAWNDWVLTDIAHAQVLNGDLAGAQKTAASIRDKESITRLRFEIATAQAKAGDFSAARKIANSATDGEKFSAVWAIVFLKSRSGDIRAALQMVNWVPGDFKCALQMINQRIDTSQDSDKRNYLIQEIARTQARKGDIAAALATADTDSSQRNRIIERIAVVQAEMGDTDGAFKTTERISNSYEKDSALHSVALARAEAGDPSLVISAAAQKRSPSDRASVLLQAAAKLMLKLSQEERQASALIPIFR